MARERLQKILARAGVASRRASEQLISEGHVTVNGELVTTLGSQADAASDVIRVDGRRLRLAERHHYYLLYKPRGVVSTLSDPQGRPTVAELLPRGLPRLFHVGRLDIDSEGLLLMTDDGELAERLMHPRHGCEKVYHVKVRGTPDPSAIARLERGVVLDGRRTSPARVGVLGQTRRDGNAWLEVSLREGRSRQVRRMLQAVGHPVSKLRRVRLGPLELKGLRRGESRALSGAELKALRRLGKQREASRG